MGRGEEAMLKMAEEYPGATPEELEIRKEQLRKEIEQSELIPNELKSELVKQATSYQHGGQFFEIKYVQGRGTKFQTGQIGWKHWAIRNDHLRLVEVLSGAAIAITTFAAVTPAAPAVLAVNLLLAVAAYGYKLRTKGASLDPDDYHFKGVFT
jgi:hypothetical protein